LLGSDVRIERRQGRSKWRLAMLMKPSARSFRDILKRGRYKKGKWFDGNRNISFNYGLWHCKLALQIEERSFDKKCNMSK
jgi:hypothetical protein